MAKLITVVNQKGGVGKTTVACHLAFAAQAAEKSVLLVDWDTQGNASQFLSQNLDINQHSGGAEQLFGDAEIVFQKTPNVGIDILHGHVHLEGLDLKRDEILMKAIDLRAMVRGLPYDYVIFDTPPSIGPRHAAPLFWSDLAVVTIQPNLASMTGLASIFETINGALEINPGLTTKMVINLFTKSSAKQKKMCLDLKEKFGHDIIGEFTMRVPVSDALADFKPVWKYSKDKKLNEAWMNFSMRVLDIIA